MALSLREILNNETDDCSGFYDWFCSDKTLERRKNSFVPKLKFLLSEGIIKKDSLIWFKNNCPVDGSLYDDCRIGSGDDYRGGFCPKSGHRSVTKKASIWFFKSGTRDLVEFDFNDWACLKKEIKNNAELKAMLIKAFN